MASLAIEKIIIVTIICFSSGLASSSHALNQARIHADYSEGEFVKVIRELEAFQKSKRTCTAAESLFLEKHLAVVYSAHPATRERGRYHMFRMLDKEPGSDLLDMFVGEEVDRVFDKVRKEHSLRMASKKTAKPVPLPEIRKVSAAPVPTKPSSATPYRYFSPEPKSTFNEVPTIEAWTSQANPAPADPITTHWDIESDMISGDTTEVKQFWKEPGVWIGGGAALAVVAFTFIYSGSEPSPPGKTYVVPATAASK